MMWVTVGLSLIGLANLFNQVVLGLLFLCSTLYVSGKVAPKINAMLMKNLAPEVLARTSNFLGLLFTLSHTCGNSLFFTCCRMEYTVDLDAICWSFLAGYSYDNP